MDIEIVNDWLRKQGYSSEHIRRIGEKLLKMDARVVEALTTLLEGNAPTIVIDGISYDYLVGVLKFKPANALITLDWLCREPTTAKKAIEEGIA